MKVASLHQLYLSHMLPRGEGWESWSVGVQTPNFWARIHPRSPDEALFPNDVDKSLSNAELVLTPLQPSGGHLAIRAADRCLDRLEILIIRQLEPLPVDWTQEILLAEDRASLLAEVFLQHCRVAARSHHVPGIGREWRASEARFQLTVPHTCTWLDADTEQGLPVYEGMNASSSLGAISAPETGSASVSDIEASMSKGEEPDLPLSLLLDADRFVMACSLREALLAAATALEASSEQFISGAGAADRSDVQQILSERISFAEKRFHRLPELLSDRSLKEEDRTTFSAVERLYRHRNELMHRGQLASDLKSLTLSQRQGEVHSLVWSAKTAVDWIATA